MQDAACYHVGMTGSALIDTALQLVLDTTSFWSVVVSFALMVVPLLDEFPLVTNLFKHYLMVTQSLMLCIYVLMFAMVSQPLLPLSLTIPTGVL